MKRTPLQRFEAKYIPEPNSGCWLWFGATVSAKGYGYIGVGPGRNELAHRFSYRNFVGPIPNGLKVLHRCDTPACVNPAHLFVGTTRDNWMDCIKKGRAPHQTKLHNFVRGDRHRCAKLKASDIPLIREMAKTETFASMGRKFGVQYTTISSVIRGKTWKHVA